MSPEQTTMRRIGYPKIGSTKQEIPARVSLEVIRKPSIKPSPESGSIFVSEDLAPVQAPLPDPGAAASEIKEAADQPSAAGRLDEGLGGCHLQAGPYSRPARRSRYIDGPGGC
jgi:hypothetical protein